VLDHTSHAAGGGTLVHQLVARPDWACLRACVAGCPARGLQTSLADSPDRLCAATGPPRPIASFESYINEDIRCGSMRLVSLVHTRAPACRSSRLGLSARLRCRVSGAQPPNLVGRLVRSTAGGDPGSEPQTHGPSPQFSDRTLTKNIRGCGPRRGSSRCSPTVGQAGSARNAAAHDALACTTHAAHPYGTARHPGSSDHSFDRKRQAHPRRSLRSNHTAQPAIGRHQCRRSLNLLHFLEDA